MSKKIDSKRTLLYDSPNLSTTDILKIFFELTEYESQLKRYDEEDVAQKKEIMAIQARDSIDEYLNEKCAMVNRKLQQLHRKINKAKKPFKS